MIEGLHKDKPKKKFQSVHCGDYQSDAVVRCETCSTKQTELKSS